MKKVKLAKYQWFLEFFGQKVDQVHAIVREKGMGSSHPRGSDYDFQQRTGESTNICLL